MAEKSNISEAEWEVMRELWKKSPLTVKEIVRFLSKRTKWKPETIRTLIHRLKNKKVINFEKKGRRHYFYPLLSKEKCVKAEAETFLSRIGGSLLKPMLVKFIEKEKLSEAEIDELQRILDDKRRKR